MGNLNGIILKRDSLKGALETRDYLTYLGYNSFIMYMIDGMSSAMKLTKVYDFVIVISED